MLFQRLRERDECGETIQVGLIAAGTFGTQIVTQMSHAPGMRIAAIAELDGAKALRAYELAGIERSRVVCSETPDEINAAIASGHPALVGSARALMESGVDLIIEATGSVEVGAGHARYAIAQGKHVVMVTVEADVVVGLQLRKLAAEAGVIYSAAYGDEPSLAFELWDWASALGFRVVAAGKGTRFKTSFRKANPDDVPRMYGFTGRDYNAQMFGSFLDGTKHAIEMACLANMSGLVPDVRGMHFPTADLREIPDKLSHENRGGILEQEGVVEAVSSIDERDVSVERSIRGGLYCVVEGRVPHIMDSLGSYGEIIGQIIGQRSGYSMIYRPQHWCGHEMPITVARIMLDNQPSGTPIGQHAEVICAAKKSLSAGTVLDGEGGYCVYGLLEKAVVARGENLLPVGLSQGAVLRRDIPEDGLVRYDDVELADSAAWELRQLQDAEVGEKN
ncbi:MAG: flagellar biosynthesis protein FlgA [Gemmatimonadetes bacterium]|nr:flagellar biosynthesis protein FlgA [Gemmatimonadota bacterium]